MNVIVYVEGPSDQKALQALLKPLIDTARVRVSFLPQNGKATILADVPRKAAKHLRQHAEDWVFAVPDLYPMASYDKGPHKHRSFAEMVRLLHTRFQDQANDLRLAEGARKRFRVHCLKHDLEALILAAPEALRQRLKTTDALHGGWRRPVEEQNDDKPPKRIVEQLFKKYTKRDYVDTSDAVWILERASLEAVIAACPQHFAPFVNELRAAVEGRDLDAPGSP